LLQTNAGAIPSNLLQIPNTDSNGSYLRDCKDVGAKGHPARFPAKLPEFFIKYLTVPGDLVVDIFAGSNTTGQVAEALDRKWLAFEPSREYLAALAFRFMDNATDAEPVSVYKEILAQRMTDLSKFRMQLPLGTAAE
jgi:site-specific DNA-methyltransferase (cytosine-N4-specific)